MPRPRKPTRVLKLTDTWRKDRHIEPEPESAGDLEMPSGLGPEERWFWEAHIEQVRKNGAGGGDIGTFLSACSWWGHFKRAEAKVLNGNDDYRVFIKMSMAWKNCNTAASRLGLSPTERAKLRVQEKPKQSKKSRFFA